MVGSQLGQYKIVEKIGAGGMGEVYRAEDPKLGRDVAIKVLPEGFTSDPERLARFEREAQAVAALSHPNILSIFDFDTQDGITYAVMELLEGDTLRQLVDAGPIPARKALDYAKQMADGLAAAHDKGIIHRDLKPENVFVSRDGRVKILDFGLARQTGLTGGGTDTHSPTLADATEAGAVLGTVGYMSPEQVKGEPADARSDIFSLGLVLYEMLGGERAFERETGAEIMTAILREDPPDLASKVIDLSPSVDRLVRHCLEKRPDERFQSARDLAFDLDAMTGFSTTGAEPRIETESSSKGRWKWIAAALAIPILAVSHYVVFRTATSTTPVEPPRFQRLTFQRGSISGAQFSPDGQTVIYSASWQGSPIELYSTRLDSPESKSLGLPSANIFAVSPNGELAIGLDPQLTLWSWGRLATIPLMGGAPRELAGNVEGADWSADGQTLVVTNPFGETGNLESPPGTPIIELPGRLTHPRISPDGQWIAVCHNPNPGDTRGEIMIVDWEGNTQVISKVYPDVNGVSWSPDGDEVWFTAKGDSTSSYVRAATPGGDERTLYRGVGDVHIHDVSPDGLVLLERFNGRWETAGRGTDGDHDQDFSIFEWSLIRDVSHDGKTLLIAETGDASGSEYAVYLRHTGESAPIRLGVGEALSLSPSGNWVIARSVDSQRLFLYPTGAGQPRTFDPPEIDAFDSAQLLDDQRALVTARRQDSLFLPYLLELETGQMSPVASETSWSGPASPDGRLFVSHSDTGSHVWSIEGGLVRDLPDFGTESDILQWTEDSSGLFIVRDFDAIPALIEIFDLATDQIRPFLEVAPIDRAGTGVITSMRINPAGTAYAYSYPRIFSELHVVEGLR